MDFPRIFPAKLAYRLKDVKLKISIFQNTVSDFRTEFQAKCPFKTQVAAEGKSGPKIAFALIDEYVQKTRAVQDSASQLNDLERLFEMGISEHPAITHCETELVLLKRVWDAVQLVEDIFEAWDAILWCVIQPLDLLEQVKQMQILVEKLPKETKNWQVEENFRVLRETKF